jgi:hypothetical protein
MKFWQNNLGQFQQNVEATKENCATNEEVMKDFLKYYRDVKYRESVERYYGIALPERLKRMFKKHDEIKERKEQYEGYLQRRLEFLDYWKSYTITHHVN